jgi:hypothetical protein
VAEQIEAHWALDHQLFNRRLLVRYHLVSLFNGSAAKYLFNLTVTLLRAAFLNKQLLLVCHRELISSLKRVIHNSSIRCTPNLSLQPSDGLLHQLDLIVLGLHLSLHLVDLVHCHHVLRVALSTVERGVRVR